MRSPNLPPRGKTNQIARFCMKWTGGEWGPAENTCGKLATHHVFWDEEGDSTYACATHTAEIRRLWDYHQIHALSPFCGMPGALWFPAENTCRYDDDGLPVAEERETREVVST